ncbi:MAG TPA: aminoglycoside phosphotransferase family protein [Acidobacteriaceae bacterium]|nr:aminoglycoside phosphotransferase family protein [Acidobacteriaceae bacterium]
MEPELDAYLALWGLIPDGEPIWTRSSRLLPVLRSGAPAMLKVAIHPEEKQGARLMAWWDGVGAARVMEHDAEAILLERATGARSLAAMVADGRDDEASRILCDVISELHRPRAYGPPELTPLSIWFRSLEPMAQREGGVLLRCAEVARELLADLRDVVLLHGDVHHGNVLDFGPRGWLAIDPKGLVGERGFDYANLFCNPEHGIALAPGRLARQADIVAEAGRLERGRLLQWIAAWAGLSAAWSVEDGESDAGPMLEIARLALGEIDGSGRPRS